LYNLSRSARENWFYIRRRIRFQFVYRISRISPHFRYALFCNQTGNRAEVRFGRIFCHYRLQPQDPKNANGKNDDRQQNLQEQEAILRFMPYCNKSGIHRNNLN